MRTLLLAAIFSGMSFCWTLTVHAQSVGLPTPRLLTTMPMGAKAGSEVEITITGEYLEEADELTFSDPRLSATRILDEAGQPIPFRYLVTVAPDCPVGVHEARVMTRLGISSSRAFTVGTLDEVVRTKPNTSLADAMELQINTICNAVMTQRAVDYYSFEGRQGERIVVDCATRGIDSKLNAVLIIADAAGRDLLVERRGGSLDFTVPEEGRYVIKVHEITFKGGPAYYYRLALQKLPSEASVVRLPSTQTVNSFSWPPTGLPEKPELTEQEPNSPESPQKISLPCDIAGHFFPAADVDVFEFEAKKGEVWWVEVASERFGLPTDPAIVVQRVERTDNSQTLTDVAEFSDIPSPVRVSSNGYAYDGPPYNAGSADVLGQLEIKEDGIHRLQLSDQFGGTRNDPRNEYRLVVRKAAPDFALVSWALHMELRNGDRNAVSKPLALRGGATMALEVVAIRRDGFEGEIELFMEGLPEGITAQGLKIPSGQSRGMMLVTADPNAPRAFGNVTFSGRANIDGETVTRPCRLASMAWPIPDAWSDLPSPRLLADVPISVSGFDFAPLTIAPTTRDAYSVTAGEKLTIPLAQTRRSEFSGAAMKCRTMGAGFEGVPMFDVALTADSSEVVLDTATLKTQPGEYVIAFYGGAVAKYRHRPKDVDVAEEACRKAEEDVAAIDAEVKNLMDNVQAAAPEKKSEIEQALAAAMVKQKAAADALTAATARLKQATDAAAPRDIVDIVVSEPITIHVQPAEK